MRRESTAMRAARKRHLLALDMERYGHVAAWNQAYLSDTHNFADGSCPHSDCGASGTGDVTGYQCAECGHYFPRNRVRMDEDSEVRCRIGMGCDNAPTIRHAIRRREQMKGQRS